MAKIEASLEDEAKKSEKYLNQLKYAKADMENLQKQTQKRIEDTISRANGRLLMQLLPILDELEMAIEASKNGEANIVEGVDMVKGKLQKVMTSEGVAPIDALGEPFDPRYHEAVLEVDTEDHPNGAVIEELRRGYMYNSRVLRASMVKVARNRSSDNDKEEDKDE
ncbi:nucleotide exchange factor GrpE [Candidatus Bathyarchaeota archaeon]|nr:nucleotide exchange factor GrpE [Candidatus Bathyarchaeota archaeon]MBL7168687.1 nucleotide exchange factor GrpE [Candidatus Bathyarchaeota archaeon]